MTGLFDLSGRLTLWASSQSPFAQRNVMATALKPFGLSVPAYVILAEDSYRDDVELRWLMLLGESTQVKTVAGDHVSIFREQSRELNATGLSQLRTGLAELPVNVLPSRGNFLLIDLQQAALRSNSYNYITA